MSENQKVIILAGGFGTRLGEPTTPKGLIQDREGKPLILPLLEDILSNFPPSSVMMVTNGLFKDQYQQRLEELGITGIQITSNGVMSAEKRLGAIGDLLYGLEQAAWHHHDVLVCPSDTVYSFKLEDFIRFAQQTPQSMSTVFRRMDADSIKNRLGCGVITEGRVIKFVEKPAEPPDVWGAIPFYYYPRAVVPAVRQYAVDPTVSLDAPGSVIPWFLNHGLPVSAFCVEGETIDVGTPEDIRKLRDR